MRTLRCVRPIPTLKLTQKDYSRLGVIGDFGVGFAAERLFFNSAVRSEMHEELCERIRGIPHPD